MMDNNIPPNDPYAQQPPNGQSPNDNDADYAAIESRGPSLGGGPGKVIAFGVIMVVVLGFIISSMFSDGKPKTNKVDVTGGLKEGEATEVGKYDAGSSGNSAPTVPLPSIPKATLPAPPTPINTDSSIPPLPTTTDVSSNQTEFVTPPLPTINDNTPNNSGARDGNNAAIGDIPPPPPPPPSTTTSPLIGGTPESNEKANARIHSNMLVVDGQKLFGADTATEAADQSLNQSDSNRAFANNVLRGTPAQKVTATRLNNLHMTIAQGKIVNAVLETAINTDLPGTLRAIVSRDTYAEAGRNILIPKGSRLIGSYNTGIAHGQKRVMIIWTRLIRPDGMDIMIGSPAIDGLGRAGIEGFVDNKYLEIFSGAMLTTALSIGAADLSGKLVPGQGGSSTTTTGGSSTTTTTAVSPSAQAAATAVGDLSALSKSVIGNLIDARPTITIDQGTRINVFVNKDLTFPTSLEERPFIQ